MVDVKWFLHTFLLNEFDWQGDASGSFTSTIVELFLSFGWSQVCRIYWLVLDLRVHAQTRIDHCVVFLGKTPNLCSTPLHTEDLTL